MQLVERRLVVGLVLSVLRFKLSNAARHTVLVGLEVMALVGQLLFRALELGKSLARLPLLRLLLLFASGLCSLTMMGGELIK